METINFGSIVIDPRLVICQTKKISIVLNLFQTRCGLAFMAIPRDSRPLKKWALKERMDFIEETDILFSILQACFPNREFEFLLNGGKDVGQTIPHVHAHLFVGEKKPLLNWGKKGIPSSLSPRKFTGRLPTGQYNLYKGKEDWLLIPRPDPKLFENPRRRGKAYPIIKGGKLSRTWEQRISNIKYLMDMP